MNVRKNAGIALSVLCFATGVTACGGSSESGSSELLKANSTDELVEAAREEGQLDLSWLEGTWGTNLVSALSEGFKEHYGLDDLEVKFTPGQGIAQQTATLANEAQAGQTPTTDVYLGYASYLAELAQLPFDTLAKVDWSWSEDIPADAVTKDGVGVSFQTVLPVITYNSEKVSEPPASMADLLDPKWKGQVASTPYAAGFDYMAMVEGADETTAYLKDFSRAISGLIACNDTDQLITGKYNVFALDCSQLTTERNIEAGGPLRYVIPSDVPVLAYVYMSVPAKSAHPAAAQLWINYLMTPEGQATLYEQTAGDSTFVEGSRTGDVVKSYEGKGLDFYEASYDVVISTEDYPGGEWLQSAVQTLSSGG